MVKLQAIIQVFAALNIMTFAFLFCSSSLSAQDAPTASEPEIKAAFVFNFARFIEWPVDSFAGTDAPFVVGVLGDDPVSNDLTRLYSAKTVSSRSFRIRKLAHGQDLRGCQILFIGASEKKEALAILQSLRGTSVLTIGDTEGFIRQGGAVRFFILDGRMRFEINLDATARAKLNVSSKLLGVAWVTTDERPSGLN
jgi:hypothetical protein